MKIWIALPVAATLFAAPIALAQDHQHGGDEKKPEAVEPAPEGAMDHSKMDHGKKVGAMDAPMMGAPMMEMDHSKMGGMMMDHGAGHDMPDEGLFGGYAMSRDASGTAWQPDNASHGGIHAMRGKWMMMSHVLLNGVYDWQDGPRGDEKAFVAGMAMTSARRDLDNGGTINLRAMLSPDPLMGKSGYPLLFAAGETADGVTPLVDRQHPHDLFMELAGSYTQRLSSRDSVFVYAGLPGEPAFGPPAFMHRPAAVDSPEAPITHHWLDSTHITFGVLTAGYVHGDWKIEASRFRGREPDEERYDIETGDLDSTAVRLSWNPTKSLALQASWADVSEPEQLEPGVDEERWSVSALYTVPVGDGTWSNTLAYGEKAHEGEHAHGALLVESAYMPNDKWTFFGRAEQIETGELAAGGDETVSRLSLGAIRDFRVAEHVKLGIGALAQKHFAPSGLEDEYDGDPMGAMAFVRLKIG
jgi:hypothetical protein